jgi:ribosome biogenesis GTPase / thiamine phosphate phosphatase
VNKVDGSSVTDLAAFGWTPEREAIFAAGHAALGLVPGRVVSQQRETVRAMTSTGQRDVLIQRGFRRDATGGAAFPAVGDWVALEIVRDGSAAILREVLPRSSAFSRGQADGGGRIGEQVLAANVDTALLLAAVTGDFNLRRLERYLALAWSSGAQPAIVLNKADLCEEAGELDQRLQMVSEIAADAPIHAISALTGEGLAHLRRYLLPGATVVLLGSSGVGKSTLTNALMGTQAQLVREVRQDDQRGRHTTTGRELFVLPDGALLIDTPGLRAVGLWDAQAGLDTAFSDIDDIAAHCRFNDCRHETEPGCAIRAALSDGSLAPERLRSRRKLERELRSQEIRSSPASVRAAGRAFHRQVRHNARLAEWRNGARDSL